MIISFIGKFKLSLQKETLSLTLLLISTIIFSISTTGQTQPNGNGSDTVKLRIYMDCWDCDFAYFRKNLPYVDFVRDPNMSDVHLLVTEQRTAGGGREYGLNFIGSGAYSDLNFKLAQTSPPYNTRLETWKDLLKTTEMGLMPFMAKTSEMENISIFYRPDSLEEIADQSIYDEWNYWVFRLGLGGEFEIEESQKEFAFAGSFNVDRITEKVKFRSDIRYEVDIERFEDDSEVIESLRELIDSDIEFVYSLGPRWSAGFFSEIRSSTYENTDFANRMGPAIEYNIFPWDESDRRIFSLGYHLESNYFDYIQPTIYSRTNEWRASESLRLTLILRQPWGEIDTRLEGSHYFHDFSKNNLNLRSRISVNVGRGLSFYLRMFAELIHDQLYLPAGDISLEELLLRQRKLQTSYDIAAQFGITFTFGSIYNNIVNQRF